MTATLLTRDEVLALRDQAEAGHWDNVAEVRLLREVERVIRPVLRATACRYRVPVEELTSTTMRAGWQALRRYDPAKSPDPWGWVAATARRAGGDAAVMASTGQTARWRARLAAAVEAWIHRVAGRHARRSRRAGSVWLGCADAAGRSGASTWCSPVGSSRTGGRVRLQWVARRQ